MSEEDPEFKANNHEKDSPYRIETIWNSSSDLILISEHKRADSDKRELAWQRQQA